VKHRTQLVLIGMPTVCWKKNVYKT